jgi:catechol 2,3-dioxygenase-like lactoylglutathione lyase family enzyme
MARKKKSKKDKKAARKTKKEARKAAKRAAAAAKLVAPKAAPKAAPQTVKKAPPKAARKPAAKVAKKPVARRTARQQPESLRLRAAGPSFTVNDIEKSLAFYRDVLGFTLKERWEQDGALHGVEMVAGSVTFWLGQDDWKKGRDRVKGQGFRIYCETSQDVDAIARRIQAAGGTLLEGPKDESWGGRACAVADPDGFTITLATNT